VDMWICGYVDMWICGYVDMWICGYDVCLDTMGMANTAQTWTDSLIW